MEDSVAGPVHWWQVCGWVIVGMRFRCTLTQFRKPVEAEAQLAGR